MPSLRDALEAALVEDPDDLATHHAYADYLQEQGDPRGEFIQVQLALEDPNRTEAVRRKLLLREQTLLAKHGRKWLGCLADELLGPVDSPWAELLDVHQIPYAIRFARGWLDRIFLSRYGCGFKTASVLGRLLCKAPEVRLLRELVLESNEGIIERLIHSPYLGNLRLFQLGHNQLDDDDPARSTVAARLAPDFVARLPRIEELYLLAEGYDPARLFTLRNLHHLRVLWVYHLAGVYPLELLANNPTLRELSDLRLQPFASSQPLIGLASVRALLHSRHLPKLSRLQLSGSDLGDVGCTEIVTSGILKRLEALDLSDGEITDVGARILADCPDLRHLEQLDIDGNLLTQTGIDALRSVLGPALRVDHQRTSRMLGYRRYVAEDE